MVVIRSSRAKSRASDSVLAFTSVQMLCTSLAVIFMVSPFVDEARIMAVYREIAKSDLHFAFAFEGFSLC